MTDARSLLSPRQPLATRMTDAYSKRRRIETSSFPGKAEPRQSLSLVGTHKTLPQSADICRTVHDLFEQEIQTRHCVSARLIACFALASLLEPKGPLWELCHALVHVEAVSNRLDETDDNNSQTADKTRPRISFCGFDFSSSLPPVDRVEGSEKSQHDLIESLIHVKRSILAVEVEAASERSKLKHLVDFMKDQENVLKWQHACARSMNEDYPLQRIQVAWQRYLAELDTLLSRIDSTPSTVMFAHASTYPLLPVEQRLAHFVGQAVRRELRHLLNPPPPRGCLQDVNYERRAAMFSQASNYVEFGKGAKGAATAEKNLAALMSTALQCLYDYFGLESLMQASPDALIRSIPTTFCASKASMKETLAAKTSLVKDKAETDLEVDCIQVDIDQATAFLKMVGACRFLIDLFDIPQVQSEVERRGGWSQLETLASLSWQYQFYDFIEEDAHFTILANVSVFLDKLRSCQALLMTREADCLQSLLDLTKRKRLSTKSADLIRQFPHITFLREYMKEAREYSSMFPRVFPATL